VAGVNETGDRRWHFRFHDLRHSCASALVQNGANLAEVATLLGHKGLQMSLRYAHVGNAEGNWCEHRSHVRLAYIVRHS
jgi:integrase